MALFTINKQFEGVGNEEGGEANTLHEIYIIPVLIVAVTGNFPTSLNIPPIQYRQFCGTFAA